jgi:hypothetical protein
VTLIQVTLDSSDHLNQVLTYHLNQVFVKFRGANLLLETHKQVTLIQVTT